MQRKFGKFLPREADDAQVSNVIHEFNEADNMLATVGQAILLHTTLLTPTVADRRVQSLETSVDGHTHPSTSHYYRI
jgi:hypothetical protein